MVMVVVGGWLSGSSFLFFLSSSYSCFPSSSFSAFCTAEKLKNMKEKRPPNKLIISNKSRVVGAVPFLSAICQLPTININGIIVRLLGYYLLYVVLAFPNSSRPFAPCAIK
jgi:hypothetical protein